MPIYMKYEGIPGQCTAKGYEKQIELQSCQFGVGRGVSQATRGGNRETSAPSISEVVVTKSQDESSQGLFSASLFGEGQPVVITFTKTGNDGKSDQKYFTITMTNTLVSGFSVSSGGDRPMESVSLNFTKIETSYDVADEKNKTAKPLKASWNLATGTV